MFLTYAGGAWERKTTTRDIVAFLLTGRARGDIVSSLNAWQLPGLGRAFILKHLSEGDVDGCAYTPSRPASVPTQATRPDIKGKGRLDSKTGGALMIVVASHLG